MYEAGEEARRAAERAARESYGRLRAYLARAAGDLTAAEDAISHALMMALTQWPQQGVPQSPDAWLLTVARRHAAKARRHAQVQSHATSDLLFLSQERLDAKEAVIPDHRLSLMFVCAHPAIDEAARAPLMLQTVLGIEAEAIAGAFLTTPRAMSQRLVRAKQKIRAAGIRFAHPDPSQWRERLGYVLDAIYAAYTQSRNGILNEMERREWGDEALYLARLAEALCPDEPEAKGLLALILYVESRKDAGRDDHGTFIPLDEQETGLWKRPMIEEAEALVRRAAAFQQPGRFQLEAAIQSAHVSRAWTGKTPWPAILQLYQALIALVPTLGARVAGAAALVKAGHAREALAALDGLAEEKWIENYQPYWATRAEVEARLGDRAALASYQRAMGLSEDAAVRAFLLKRLEAVMA